MAYERNNAVLFDPNLALPVLDHYTVPTRTGDTVTIGDVARRHAQSPYGLYQSGQTLRFTEGLVDYEPAAMREDCGADVDPNGHQILTAYFGVQFLHAERAARPDFLTDFEVSTTLFTDVTHDSGEPTHPALGADSIGDIPFGKKTPEHRAKEMNIWQRVIDETFPDIDPAVVQRSKSIISHEDTTILHDFYEAHHCVLTLETARLMLQTSRRKLDLGIVQAATLLGALTPEPAILAFVQEIENSMGGEQNGSPDEDAIKKVHKLRNLGRDVVRAQSPKLFEFAEQFVYARSYADTYKVSWGDIVF